jgi:SAM-dependent methyltransferase
MTPDERWLAALWPSVRAALPAPHARVLEIGCGPLGGFVPMLRDGGYEATGIDPEAPEGTDFRRVGFEDYLPSRPADAIIACTSLHHVADLDRVLDLAAAALVPAGVLVVVEWARERFDEATAQWCFARLPSGEDRGWLNDRYEQWQASGQRWDAYFRSWADGEGLHSGQDILRALQVRFETRMPGAGPMV